MRQFAVALSFLLLVTGGVFAQGKGVDQQSQRVRGTSSDRPANNGAKQDTGTGRGIDWGGGKSRPAGLLDNPYRLAGRRDVIIKAVEEVMQDRKLVLDESASRLTEGIVISQPYRFIKGAVVSASQLGRYADVQQTLSRGWTQGRYTITVEVQAIDGVSSNVSVNAKIEGRSDGATGAEWITLPSLGRAEDEFLSALVEKVTGVTPPGHATTPGP